MEGDLASEGRVPKERCEAIECGMSSGLREVNDSCAAIGSKTHPPAPNNASPETDASIDAPQRVTDCILG